MCIQRQQLLHVWFPPGSKTCHMAEEALTDANTHQLKKSHYSQPHTPAVSKQIVTDTRLGQTPLSAYVESA